LAVPGEQELVTHAAVVGRDRGQRDVGARLGEPAREEVEQAEAVGSAQPQTGGAEAGLVAQWFATASVSSTATGFAIGRSIFWSPATQFLLNEIPETDAIERMTTTYLELVDLWRAAS